MPPARLCSALTRFRACKFWFCSYILHFQFKRSQFQQPSAPVLFRPQLCFQPCFARTAMGHCRLAAWLIWPQPLLAQGLLSELWAAHSRREGSGTHGCVLSQSRMCGIGDDDGFFVHSPSCHTALKWKAKMKTITTSHLTASGAALKNSSPSSHNRCSTAPYGLYTFRWCSCRQSLCWSSHLSGCSSAQHKKLLMFHLTPFITLLISFALSNIYCISECEYGQNLLFLIEEFWWERYFPSHSMV